MVSKLHPGRSNRRLFPGVCKKWSPVMPTDLLLFLLLSLVVSVAYVLVDFVFGRSVSKGWLIKLGILITRLTLVSAQRAKFWSRSQCE